MFNSVFKPLLSVLIGLSAGIALTAVTGENPIHVAEVLVKSAFGADFTLGYDFGMTLFYTLPIVLTGLSVAVAFHAGLFNVGAEGQLTLGALAVAAVLQTFSSLPFSIALILALLSSMLVGGIWGGIAGILKVKRGSHEVINTIMLNFIAAGLASYFTLYYFKDPDNQNPETISLPAEYLFSGFEVFGDARVGMSLFWILGLVVLFWFLLNRTRYGFELKAVGENIHAARSAGMNAGQLKIAAMIISGALAGLVGVLEVLGNSGKFKLGFSPGFGFTGIAVALLGRNQPFGVLLAAFLFGALHKGTTDLDFETEKVTRDLSLILQAFVILAVSVNQFKLFRFRTNLKRGVKNEL